MVEPKLEQLADELAAVIAKGSSDNGSKHKKVKRLLIKLVEEIKRQAIQPLITSNGYCSRCDTRLTTTDIEADECTQCGLSLEPPARIPCSYPQCTRTTTFDPTYGDLCYEHIRASNE